MFDISNNIFVNWNKELYIANKIGVEVDDYNNEIVKYGEPFYFGEVNYQPLTGKQLEAYIRTYGETTNNIASIVIYAATKFTIEPNNLLIPPIPLLSFIFLVIFFKISNINVVNKAIKPKPTASNI